MAPLAKKLWMVSRVLNTSPFSPDLLNHTEAQLDFILEMHAADNPDDFRFVRPGMVTPLPSPEAKAEWERRLIGTAHDRYMHKRMPSAAALAAATKLAQAGRNLKKGVILGPVQAAPKKKP